jgi:DNA primase
MLDRLAQLAHMELDALERMLGSEAVPKAPAAAPAPAKPAKRAAASRHQPSLVRSAIGLLLQRPALAQLVGEPRQLAALHSPGIPLLVEMLDLLRQHPHLTTGALLEHWRESEQGRHLFALAQRDMLLSAEEDNLEQEFSDTVARLLQQLRRQRRLELEQRFSSLSEAERTEYTQLLRGNS